MKIKVGDIVKPDLKGSYRKLVIWSGEEDDAMTAIAEICENAILTVIKTQKNKHAKLNPEWKDLSCMVLAPCGTVGWVGAGWLEKINSN